jgi:hypothetical protein
MSTVQIVNGATNMSDARQWLQDRLERGVKCPCCDQMAKVYKRSINHQMAAVLILLARYFNENKGEKFVHVEKHIMSTGAFKVMPREWQKLRYWGLMEPQGEVAEDGNPCNGFWFVTDEGIKFAKGLIRVPKNVFVYSNVVIAKTESVTIDIHDSLKKKFNYSELMGLQTAQPIKKAKPYPMP